MFRLATIFALIFTSSLVSLAQGSTDFTGAWRFEPAKGKNIGMMAQMQMTTVIEQSPEELTQKVDATMMGQNQKQELRFDLSGKPVVNETPMGEKSTTVTKWEGAKLVTTWTTPGAVAGSTKVSVETLYLSADGKTLYVETTCVNKPPVVMVYSRK